MKRWSTCRRDSLQSEQDGYLLGRVIVVLGHVLEVAGTIGVSLKGVRSPSGGLGNGVLGGEGSVTGVVVRVRGESVREGRGEVVTGLEVVAGLEGSVSCLVGVGGGRDRGLGGLGSLHETRLVVDDLGGVILHGLLGVVRGLLTETRVGSDGCNEQGGWKGNFVSNQ